MKYEMCDEFKKAVELCNKKAVGFSLTYAEADTSWYFEINSPAPAERYISRGWPYKDTIELLIEKLEQL